MYTYDEKVHISSSLVFRSFRRTSPLFFDQELVDQVSPWKYGGTLFADPYLMCLSLTSQIRANTRVRGETLVRGCGFAGGNYII